MAIELRKASKKQLKLRLCMEGVPDSGKSYSSLLLAYGFVGDWSKICVIDTEKGRGELYTDLGDYNVATLDAPFTPERYIEAIIACEKAGMELIIIDSISHEWAGAGGCLEIQGNLGGRFQDWSAVTPRHNKFIEKMMQSSCHIIATVRKKEHYEVEKDSKGKTVVTKNGLEQVQKGGLNYEFMVVFDIQHKTHKADPTKDNTQLFKWTDPQIITKEHGKMLRDWCDNGAPAPVQEPEKMATGKQENKLLVLLQKSLDLKIIKKEDYDSRIEMINTHKYTEEKAQRAIDYLTTEIKRKEDSHD